MANPVDLRRVIFAHEWQDAAEWVRALDHLADLTDAEIETLVAATSASPSLPVAA